MRFILPADDRIPRRAASGRARVARRLAVSMALAVCGAAIAAQSAPAGGPVHERQQSIREQMLRLEARLLKLTGRLAEEEPEKAERVRDALDHAGRLQLKARLEQQAALLREGRFSESEREQSALLRDLEALLAVLTSPGGELEHQRDRRKQLEAMARSVRQLMEEQARQLYQSRHLADSEQPDAVGPGDAPPLDAEAAEALLDLERQQRQTQQKAQELSRQIRQIAPDDSSPLGQDQVESAAQEMRSAADQLGQQQPGPASERQQAAMNQLQQALNELDDSLRQVRREEMEETLEALESRVRALLGAERSVQSRVQALEDKPASERTRLEAVQLDEASSEQRVAAEQCAAARRILVEEGSTVIVPALLEHISTDMSDIADRLSRGDAGADARSAISEVIASLEELLAAVEQKRDEMSTPTDEQPSAGPPQAQPLLPGSAELKLVRAAQARLAQRTETLEAETSGERADELARRQQELSELVRRMHERQ